MHILMNSWNSRSLIAAVQTPPKHHTSLRCICKNTFQGYPISDGAQTMRKVIYAQKILRPSSERIHLKWYRNQMDRIHLRISNYRSKRHRFKDRKQRTADKCLSTSSLPRGSIACKLIFSETIIELSAVWDAVFDERKCRTETKKTKAERKSYAIASLKK